MLKFLFLFLFFSLNISAEIIQSKGEIYIELDGDLNLCRDDARDKAYRNALEKVTGESIVSNQDLQCTSNDDEALCELKKRTFSLTQGIVKPVGNRTYTSEQEGDYIVCLWSEDVEVEKFTTYPDFEFRFKLSQNKFIAPIAPLDGVKLEDKNFEPITFNFDLRQPSYLYLFQNTEYMNEGKSFFKIFPNKLDDQNLFSENVIIPTNKDYEFKISFPNNLLDDVYYVNIIAIASENEISFYDEYTYKDFHTKLFEIKDQKHRYKSEIYTVLKK